MPSVQVRRTTLAAQKRQVELARAKVSEGMVVFLSVLTLIGPRMSSRSHHASSQQNSKKRATGLSEDELETRLQKVREQKKAVLSRPSLSSPHASPSSSSSEYAAEDVLKKEYRFIRTEEDDMKAQGSWEKTLAKKYHDSLFKEYVLADMSRALEGKVRNW